MSIDIVRFPDYGHIVVGIFIKENVGSRKKGGEKISVFRTIWICTILVLKNIRVKIVIVK